MKISPVIPLLLISFITTACSEKKVQEAQTVFLETYGDSLTAGAMADTNLTKIESEFSYFQSMEKIAEQLRTRGLQELARPTLAWPQVLAAKIGATKLDNASVVGAHTSNLLDQVRRTATDKNSKKANTTAIFFIGHNDACAGWSLMPLNEPHFVEMYERALSEWLELHENSMAVLIPIGNITDIFYRFYLHEIQENSVTGLRCQRVYDEVPLCDAFTTDAQNRSYGNSTSRSIMLAQNGILSWNNRLPELAQKLNLSKNGNQVTVATRPSIRPEPSHMAADCFHLSAEGQAALAEQIHSAVFSKGTH